MNCELTSTICAPATAPGGALGIIRVSGPKAFDAVSAICSVHCDAVAPNTVHFTRLIAPSTAPVTAPTGPSTGAATVPAGFPAGSEVIDEGLVTVFRAPHSYTGEDSVEISCHGSLYILNKVLELLLEQGCRMAHPGEFTMRAYLNGKMDLSQAEAVADLIVSTNSATHRMAMSQLRGDISSELSRLRDQLLKLTSLLELELDFSDHEDLEFADRSEILALTVKTDEHITRLADSFHAGNALKNGIPVAIVGAPNVGKSTLLNALLGEERAIVSDIQGTTRDAIEDTIQLGGITFRFIDTAGIRHTDDQIEQMGIERTYQMIEKSRIVLWLIDDVPTDTEIKDMQDRCQNKTLLFIQNKIDKTNPNYQLSILNSQLIRISAKYGIGLNQLRQQLVDAAPKTNDSDIIITNARHYEALTRAHSHLQRVIDGIHQQLSADLLAEDLHLVLDTLSEITGGQISTHEVLGNIFKNFCVGK